jgi:hypothetical protein
LGDGTDRSENVAYRRLTAVLTRQTPPPTGSFPTDRTRFIGRDDVARIFASLYEQAMATRCLWSGASLTAVG